MYDLDSLLADDPVRDGVSPADLLDGRTLLDDLVEQDAEKRGNSDGS